MKTRLAPFLLFVLLALPLRGQTPTVFQLQGRLTPLAVATDPCTNAVPLYLSADVFQKSKICASSDDSAYQVSADWYVTGAFKASSARIYGAFSAFDPTTGAGFGTTGTGAELDGRLLIRPQGSLFAASPMLTPHARVTADGDDTTDSVGVAVVTLDSMFLNFANTDPATGGGYLVHLTATSAESVYWDRAASTSSYFVVRTVSKRATGFTYTVTATQKTAAGATQAPSTLSEAVPMMPERPAKAVTRFP